MGRHLTLWLHCALLLGLLACASREQEGAPHAETAAPYSDHDGPAALASLAEAHHARVDLALQKGDRKGAKREVAELIATARQYRSDDDQSQDIVFDAAARLAKLHIEDSEFDSAVEVAAAGLEDADQRPPTLFRGYLHQTLAQALEGKGDPRGAVEEHGRAIEIFKSILKSETSENHKE